MNLVEIRQLPLAQEAIFKTDKYQYTYPVTDGVICHVLKDPSDPQKDVGVVVIEPGKKTPPQKVVAGLFTDEIYLTGNGYFVLIDSMRKKRVYEVGGERAIFRVEKGDYMRWVAGDAGLVIAELCTPPYQEGRFENISETEFNNLQ